MPSSLADFEILGRLGKGNFGTVYQVKRLEDGQVYCMKQMDLNDMTPAEQGDAVREVHIMAALEHPQVVRYYDSFIERGVLCIVMEYCNRGDLQRMLKRQAGHPLPEERVWKIWLQMTLGVAYLHSRRTLHRDLKTANIFLCSGDRVKIGDLGVARVLGTESYFAKTCCGTPYYLSPELITGLPYNEKSDIWSLGCVLYELCTGKRPFTGSNQGELLAAIIKGTYAPLPTEYSGELAALLTAMLNKNAAERPTAVELLASETAYRKCKELDLTLPEEVKELRALVASAMAGTDATAGTGAAAAAGGGAAAAAAGPAAAAPVADASAPSSAAAPSHHHLSDTVRVVPPSTTTTAIVAAAGGAAAVAGGAHVHAAAAAGGSVHAHAAAGSAHGGGGTRGSGAHGGDMTIRGSGALNADADAAALRMVSRLVKASS